MRPICPLALCCLIGLALPVRASDSLSIPSQRKPHEVREDEYIAVPREQMQISPAYGISNAAFLSVQVNVDSLGNNIVGDAANEPSIAIDPTNPNKMVIGWRQFNTVTNNFRQAGYGYTTNGGLTWKFPGVIQPGVFRSDPVLESDMQGNFYYNSLTTSGSSYLCDVFKSTTGGATWGSAVPARGGDKQWMTIDKTSGQSEGHHYAFWTSSFSNCPPGFFTRSVNRGASYEACVTIPQDPHWGTLAVGPEGELYVCGDGLTAFAVAKSTTARNPLQAVSWDTVTIVSLDGEIQGFVSSSPNPGGLLGQAWVAVDRSTGPSRGNVYVLCSVRRSSNNDPLDVMFSRSTNGGRTWSAPLRINDDPGTTAWQWFGTMSVAPTGRIDVVWLDTRDNPGSLNSSLYYAYSTNAGVSWSQNSRLSLSFNPLIGWPQQNKMGDYFHMISDSTAAHLAWAGTFNGEQDVYYGRVQFPPVGVEEERGPLPTAYELLQNYPNPFNPKTNIGLRIANFGLVSLKVFDLLGREVVTLVDDVKLPGTYEVVWDAGMNSSGVYLCRMSTPHGTLTRKLVLLR